MTYSSAQTAEIVLSNSLLAKSNWHSPAAISLVSSRQRWSPRGHILKSLALASKPQVLRLGLEALGPRKLPCPRLEDSTVFEQLKFCWNTPETWRKICKYLFCFPQLEHRLSLAGLPPIEISPMTKM